MWQGVNTGIKDTVKKTENFFFYIFSLTLLAPPT
jgi:hypothetical protein